MVDLLPHIFMVRSGVLTLNLHGEPALWEPLQADTIQSKGQCQYLGVGLDGMR